MSKLHSPRIIQLFIHEACFLQAVAGRLQVTADHQNSRQLEVSAITILEPGHYQLERVDLYSVGKIWPRRAKSVAAIKRIDSHYDNLSIEVPAQQGGS